MFSISDIIYYLLFVTALILSLRAPIKYYKGLFYLRILLFMGLITEPIVDILDYYGYNSYIPYYIYIPSELILLVLFYKKSTNSKLLQNLTTWLVPIYIIILVIYGILTSSIKYPGVLYNINCIILIFMSSISLINLKPTAEEIKLNKLPAFWIYTAFLIFYAGVFFYNAVYGYLLETETTLAKKLRFLINLNLNYILYTLMSISFLCSIRLKKYFTQ